MKCKKPDIEITELILAKADWKRTFIGTIERYSDDKDCPFVVGKVMVNKYQVVCQASDFNELGRFLDDMVILVLDYDLHKTIQNTNQIAGWDYFQN
jgi:hypothetical protein